MKGKKRCFTKGPMKADLAEWRQSDMFLKSGVGVGGGGGGVWRLPGHSVEWVGMCQLLR